MENGAANDKKMGVFARQWEKVKRKTCKVMKNVKKIGEDDPRRIIHSLKVGLALTLVSLFYYFRPLYYGFGVNTMWAVLTVVVVFEYTVGATLGKGLNRALATITAGVLAVGAHELASLSGAKGEPIILGAFVFIAAAIATFVRFFPKIKARYDYGMVIFMLTFSLVAVSGYRVDALIKLAHQRLSTIAIGSFTCVVISIFVCPVWAGEDLHRLVALNIEKLANFLEGFPVEYFEEEEIEKNAPVASKDKNWLQGYKSVLNSKSSEDSLVNFARWEPAHGRFRFCHPWGQYLKIGSIIRQCAYHVEGLNCCLSSEKQVPAEFQQQIQAVCTKMSLECGKALSELASSIRTMTKPISARHHVEAAKTAAANLKTVLKTTLSVNTAILEILPAVTVASLLNEITAHTEKIVASVDELACTLKFKDPSVPIERTPSLLRRSAVIPVSEAGSPPHVVITVCEAATDSLEIAKAREVTKERKMEV